MENSIIIAGFGGQGVLFAGQVLAYAAMDSGRYVTWIPSYGPEMRGGTAHCVVIISDEPIGSPLVARPDIAIVLNQPSFDRYQALVNGGGILVVNSSIVSGEAERSDIEVVAVAANALAEAYGTIKMLNMAALGALLGYRPLLPLEAIEQVLASHLPAGKMHLIEDNRRVLRQGYQVGAARLLLAPKAFGSPGQDSRLKPSLRT